MRAFRVVFEAPLVTLVFMTQGTLNTRFFTEAQHMTGSWGFCGKRDAKSALSRREVIHLLP